MLWKLWVQHPNLSYAIKICLSSGAEAICRNAHFFSSGATAICINAHSTSAVMATLFRELFKEDFFFKFYRKEINQGLIRWEPLSFYGFEICFNVCIQKQFSYYIHK